MRYLYPCNIEGNEKDGDGFVATFPDVQGAVTGGFTFKESLVLAEDCLVVALSACIHLGKELPTPSQFQDGQELLTVQPVIAAQLDLYTAMREQNISRSELAERLSVSVTDVDKLLSLDYCTPISRVLAALRVVRRELAAAERIA